MPNCLSDTYRVKYIVIQLSLNTSKFNCKSKKYTKIPRNKPDPLNEHLIYQKNYYGSLYSIKLKLNVTH